MIFFRKNGFHRKYVFIYESCPFNDKNLEVFKSRFAFCTDTWNTEIDIHFNTALCRFQFHRKKYVSLMSLKKRRLQRAAG